MHLELGETDVSSELEMGGYAVPKPLSHSSWNSQPTWSLMFLSKRYALHLLARNMTPPLRTLYSLPGRGTGKPSQLQLDLGCRLLLVAFELVAYIQNDVTCLSYMVQRAICKCGKPYMSLNPSSPFFGEIYLRASEICQVWMLSFSALNMLIIRTLNRQKTITMRAM